MKTHLVKSSIAAIIVTSVYLFAPQTFASDCKGMEQSACASEASCSWIEGYTRKDGRTVKSFCRAKPGSKSKTVLKSDTAKLDIKSSK